MRMLAVLAGLCFAATCDGMERSFRITFQVVNEEGQPVMGARIGVSWENAKATKPSERIKSAEGLTDQAGRATLEGKTFASAVSHGANKEGHYAAWGSRYQFSGAGLFRWQPWNSTVEVVLKRKLNPVPMYAKRLDRGIDILSEPYGYDLQVGDWVKPHGKGMVADFIFTRTLIQQNADDFDYELKLTFSNSSDGIQRFVPDPTQGKEEERRLVLYEAPAGGYANEWILKRSRKPGQGERTTFDNRSGYYFRVRTEVDKEGRVVKALYGKIYGDFFSFSYFLNPDGTRNIEFDHTRNLLKPANGQDRRYYQVGP